MKEDTADGKLRSLFSDVSNPTDDHASEPDLQDDTLTGGTRHPQQRKDRAKQQPQRPREWWGTLPKPAVSAASVPPSTTTMQAARRRSPMRKGALFEFDVPEHLPNSPMCPANPKNISGGKGVCVVNFYAPDLGSLAIFVTFSKR